MTMVRTVKFMLVLLLVVHLAAEADASDVVTGDCAATSEALASCSATGDACLDQALSLFACLDGDGLVEVKADSIGMVIVAGSASSTWRLSFPKPSREKGTIHYRIGKCYANPRPDDDADSAARALVRIRNKDDPRNDYRYQAFANPNCDGRQAVGTAMSTAYFSEAVESYIDTGLHRPDWSDLNR